MAISTNDAGMPDWPSRHLWQLKPIQDVFWIGLAIAILWFGYYVRGVMIPLLIGLGLAYMINPLLSYAEERWNLPRIVPIAAILVTLLLLSVGLVAIITPIALDEIHTLAQKTPGYLTTVSQKLNAKVDDGFMEQVTKYSQQVPENPMQLLKITFANIGHALGLIGKVLSTTGYVLVSLCLIPIYFFFFAWHFNPIKRRAKRLIPETHRERVLEIGHKMDSAVGNFLRGRMLVVLAMTVMFSVGYWIAGVPYWFMLGTLTGLLSFVPYLAVIGCLLAIAVSWIDAATSSGGPIEWLQVFVWPTTAYCVVQLLEGWILTPWIQSESMEMSAVAVLIVVFIGGTVGGVYGLLLAIPLAGCLRILSQEILIPKLEHWANDA